MLTKLPSLLGFLVMLVYQCSYAQTTSKNEGLSNFEIESTILSETISVSTYGLDLEDNLPIIYITDGKKMIDNGTLKKIKQLTATDKIPEAHYVFISTIDAETQEDKRNTYFFCNDDFVRFFEEELVPRIERKSSIPSKRRSLIGISFGGLSAAFFSGKTRLFQNYALLSPITYPCQEALTSIAFSENKGLNIFISTGKNDAENYTVPLINLYMSKGYNVKSVTTDGAHDFENWNEQLELLLNFVDGGNDQ